jgi:hypothetical protein
MFILHCCIHLSIIIIIIMPKKLNHINQEKILTP